jgi:hypothetical protein
VFGVEINAVDTHQSLTLENGTNFMPALARWPSLLTDEWSLVEFKNIDWTARTFDFYYNGDLLMSSSPLGNGDGLDSIRFRKYSGNDFKQYLDEVVVR